MVQFLDLNANFSRGEDISRKSIGLKPDVSTYLAAIERVQKELQPGAELAFWECVVTHELIGCVQTRKGDAVIEHFRFIIPSGSWYKLSS